MDLLSKSRAFSIAVNNRIVHEALLLCGKGEEGANNDGPTVREMLFDVNIFDAQSWCAAAVWHCIKNGFFAVVKEFYPKYWFFPQSDLDRLLRGLATIRSAGAKDMMHRMAALGWVRPYTEGFMAGDILFLDREGKPWFGHVAILTEGVIAEKAHDHPLFANTIEANLGMYPSLVEHNARDLANEPVLGVGRVFGFFE